VDNLRFPDAGQFPRVFPQGVRSLLHFKIGLKWIAGGGGFVLNKIAGMGRTDRIFARYPAVVVISATVKPVNISPKTGRVISRITRIQVPC
jgi:hypothetical protein